MDDVYKAFAKKSPRARRLAVEFLREARAEVGCDPCAVLCAFHACLEELVKNENALTETMREKL